MVQVTEITTSSTEVL